ncbi:hypothetical protein LY76DRAFT_625342 [Colletotrichum caudatum]|nr:hypothetical protein LY76DRAFT_625342 [Colletotrichum caudatum]
MLEGVAALALAGNIVQFIEFATKFAKKCDEIHQAGGSAPHELRQLRDFVAHQQARLSQQPHLSKDQRATLLQEHNEVLHVSDQCSKKFSEIRETLDRIGLNANMTAWRTVITAFKATWNERKIEGLKNDAVLFTQGLHTIVLRSLRDFATRSEAQQKIVLEKLDIIQEGVENHTFSLADHVERGGESSWDEPGDAVIAFVTRAIDAEPGERLASAQRLRDGIIRRILSTPESAVHSVAADTLVTDFSNTRQEKLQAAFLASFVYNAMDDRHLRITKAHEHTFRWLFGCPSEETNRWANFQKWLESDESLYWITGKAGSGKSTLMKFICDGEDDEHPPTATRGRCYPHLSTWANDRPLIIASFYFWASGTEMESSPTGLYMSLPTGKQCFCSTASFCAEQKKI